MKKFRVRAFKTSVTVELNPGLASENGVLTLGHLKAEIENNLVISQLLCGRGFEISLNGKDALTGRDTTLQQLGLVSGDIVRLIVQDLSPQTAAAGLRYSADSDITKNEESSEKKIENDIDQGASTSSGAGASTSSDVSGAAGVVQMQEIDVEEDTVQDQQARDLMNEPMLLRESCLGRVPHTLAATYRNSAVTSSHEAVFVVIHVLMLEAGFNSSSAIYSMPYGWRKAGGVFKTQYTVAGDFEETVTLTYITLGTIANVVCTVRGSDIKYQQQLNPAEYVMSVCKNAGDAYANLQKLSTVFKDKISYPLLQSLRADSETPLPSLTNLMAELQLMILKHLSAKDLLNLSAVNRDLNAVTKENCLWRRLYMKAFGRRVDNNDLAQDWLEMYKNKFILRQHMRENARLMIPPPFRDPYADPYPLYPGPGYPPGFVGGDYDRDPNFRGLPGMYGPGGGPQLPRPRFDPIGPYPGMRRPQRPPLPGWGPLFRNNRRDPGFGGGGFGYM